MAPADLSPEDRSLIDSLLGAWEEAVARGEEPRPETICPDRPDLWEAVGVRAAQLASMAFLDGQDEAPVGPGDRLGGRYRLIEAIAAGGHADVWRARDERLLRDVAVKLISLGPLAVPGQLIDEGLRLASLSHPYIVRVFDAGLEGEIAFMVQELVTGDTLANRIATSPPAENEVLAWISQVAEALQAAHDHPAGIIHRDVKPTNILIDGHGKALLADFGIALPIGSAAVGTSVGTLPYKSPEQLDNQPLDRRSDVFSLGLVLYESLTGALPYSAIEHHTIRREMREPLAARIARLPGPRPLGPGLLPFLERALAVRPDARPRDAIAFRDELRRAAAGAGGFGRLRRLAIAATLVAITITLAAMVAKAVIGERARRDQRIVEAENRRQMEDVQREIDRAMDVFNGAKSKLSEVRQLERQILEQTRQRDTSRQDRKAAAGEAVKPPPQRGDEPLHGPD